MPTSTALDAVALTGRGRIQTPRARGFFETAKGGTFGSTAPVDDDAVGE